MTHIYEVRQKNLDSVTWSWRGDESDYDLQTVSLWESRGYIVKRFKL